MTGDTIWEAYCNEYFADLRLKFPRLTPQGFLQLIYSPKGRPYIACLSGYAYPRWVVLCRRPNARQE